MDRRITLELVAFGIVKETLTVFSSAAKEILSREMASGWHWRITPPDHTGNLPDDEARHGADCQACGVENVYESA